MNSSFHLLKKKLVAFKTIEKNLIGKKYMNQIK